MHEHLDETVSIRYGPHVVGRFSSSGEKLSFRRRNSKTIPTGPTGSRLMLRVGGRGSHGAGLEGRGYPDADRVAREADEYKRDLRQAVLRAAGVSPVARMRDGIYEP